MAGVRGELWSPRAAAALGPRLGVDFSPSPAWALGAGLGAVFGVRSVSGVSAHAIRPDVVAEYRPGGAEGLRVGATVLFDILSARGAGQSSTGTGFGGGAHVRYAVAAGHFVLAFGPSLLLHAGPVRVTLGASELFRIPAATAGVAVDVGWVP